MVHHKRLVFILSLAFILMGAIAVTVIFWQDPVSSEVVFTKAPEVKVKPAIGKPCNIKEGSEMDTQDLQCYYDGDVDSTTSGIWIKPEKNEFISSGMLRAPIVWKDFTSKDLGISVPILDGTLVKESKSAKGSLLASFMFNFHEDQTVITIEKFAKTSNILENRIKEEKSKGIVGTDVNEVEIANTVSRHLIIYPKTNLGDPIAIWVIEDESSYLFIRAQLMQDSVVHYALEYMIANLKINK